MPQLSEGAHTHRVSATMLLGRGTSSRSSDSHCLTAVKAALLRGKDNLCTTSCLPPEHSSSDGHVPPQGTTAVPIKAPLYGSLAALLAAQRFWHCQQHHLAAAAFSKPFRNAPGVNRSPLFICQPGCAEGQWHCGGTHCVHSPWHLDRHRRSPAWEQGDCTNCIMYVYHLPLWVQGWLIQVPLCPKSSISLAQSWPWLQSCGNQVASHQSISAKKAVLPLGGSMEWHFLKGRKLLFLFSAFAVRTYLLPFSSPPSPWPFLIQCQQVLST